MDNEINTTQTSVLRLSPDMSVSELVHASSIDASDFVVPDDVTMDELLHSGVKGMRWGVRRYQNKDGTLTAAGKKREAAERKGEPKKSGGVIKNTGKKIATKFRDRKAAKDKEKAEKELNEQKAKLRKKRIDEMTDDELKTYIERKKLEREAAAVDDQVATFKSHARSVDNLPDTQNPNQGSGNSGLGGKLMNDVVVPAATTAGKAALTSYLNKSLNKALGLSEGTDGAMEALKKSAEASGYKKTIAEARKATAEAIAKERENANRERRDAEREAAERVKSEAYNKPPNRTTNNSNPYRYTSSDPTNRGVDIVSSYSSAPASSITGNGGYLTAGRSAVAGYLPAPKDDD